MKTVLRFTGSGTMNYTFSTDTDIEYFIVGGGGAGGSGNSTTVLGGGGGGGEVLTGTTTLSGTVVITVGSGGTASTSVGSSGGNTIFSTHTAKGGLGGDSPSNCWAGVTGIGGTAGSTTCGGDRSGCSAGGGGGAGGLGQSAGTTNYAGGGGAGIARVLSGETLYFGSGGGGCSFYGGEGGGTGAGGHGYGITFGTATAGIDGLGTGGGGGGQLSTGSTGGGEELFGIDYNPTGDPIGGGEGYSDIKTTGLYVVDTEAELVTAAGLATSGQVIYITGSVSLDVTGYDPIEIADGVTVASNRGFGGSLGALIVKNDMGAYGGGWAWNDPIFLIGDNCRITGLRLEGQMLPSSDDPLIDESYYRTGILAHDCNFEVDNCEIRGFAWAGIYAHYVADDTVIVNVHHNYIHFNIARSEGYGIQVDAGTLYAYANIFDQNRHSIAASAEYNSVYFARYNKILGYGQAIGGATFDHHGLSGDLYIQFNTQEYSDADNDIYFCVLQDTTTGAALYCDHNVIDWYYQDVPGTDRTIRVIGSMSTCPDVLRNYCGHPSTDLYVDETDLVDYP